MAASPAAPKDGKAEEKFALTSSRHFSAWLDRVGASLAFTTYQAGKVFFIGRKRECSNVPSPAAWDSASGLMVVATTSGDTVEWARLEGVVRELFDVAFIFAVGVFMARSRACL